MLLTNADADGLAAFGRPRSRRHWFRHSGSRGRVAGTLVLAAGLLLGTTAHGATSNANAGGGADAEKPVDGGTLIYGRSGDSVSLDPGRENDGESLNVTDNIFDTLVQFKPGTTDLEPGLAKEWSVSPDGKVYTFKLREGVTFHDGTRVDADAVVFSLLRQHDPKHEAYGYAKAWQYWMDMGMNKLVKSVAKGQGPGGDMTVRIELTQPSAPLLANLAMSFCSIVSPTAVRKFKDRFAENPVGSGPFRFKSWTRGERIVLDANPGYWGGKPHLARVIIRTIPDNAARLGAFLSKEIHVMNLPTADELLVIQQKRPDARLIKEPSLNVSYVAFNMKKAPFDKLKVRQALNLAVDRKAILKGVYGGLGEIATTPLPTVMWGFNKSVKPVEQDVEKAKRLLREAGFPNGFSADLYYLPVARPYLPDGKRAGEALQADFKRVGVNVTLTTYEWATYLERASRGEHQMILSGWSGDNGDPDNFLYAQLSGDNAKVPAQNYAFYVNSENDALLATAQREPRREKRAELYVKSQSLIARDAPWIPLVHAFGAIPVDARVHGFVPDPNGSRRFARVWLAAEKK